MKQKMDLTGKLFGQLTVIAEGQQRRANRRWLCVCSCGARLEVQQGNLLHGHSQSCGCTAIARLSRSKIRNITGNQYGRLLVLGIARKRVSRQWFWHCLCRCGTYALVRGNALTSGNTTSCGCGYAVHGMSGTKPYKRFHTMKRHCARLQRTPAWADLDAIAAFYRGVPEGHHVDHIVPLLGKNVSGLHVLNNLQYLPKRENCSKNNRFVICFESKN